ncbi:hypothetical protein JS44_14570 [Anoxybacillus flavithermus]|uniref:Uncharacterized protein n=1 Tax=Anoxybacillus flavithermus TaxID=33934 RepID=A0A094IX10_9BACL|nr:hypothetical protein JS44_14570 [Anoxybacillus flavithermus]
MKITLAQSINLLSFLKRRVDELQAELLTTHTVTVPKGEMYTPPERTVEQVLTEMIEIQKDVLALQELINETNMQQTVEWEGERISLIRAIETAKMLRSRVHLYKRLGDTKPREYYGGNVVMETIALFNPSEYKQAAEMLARQVEVLSSRIDKVNYTVEIDVSLASKYLEA